MGVGGRITIPYNIRESMKLLEKEGSATLNLRVEETRTRQGVRHQLVVWEKPAPPPTEKAEPTPTEKAEPTPTEKAEPTPTE